MSFAGEYPVPALLIGCDAFAAALI